MMESQIWLNVGACVLAAVVAYLLGSISSAVIVSTVSQECKPYFLFYTVL